MALRQLLCIIDPLAGDYMQSTSAQVSAALHDLNLKVHVALFRKSRTIDRGVRILSWQYKARVNS